MIQETFIREVKIRQVLIFQRIAQKIGPYCAAFFYSGDIKRSWELFFKELHFHDPLVLIGRRQQIPEAEAKALSHHLLEKVREPQ